MIRKKTIEIFSIAIILSVCFVQSGYAQRALPFLFNPIPCLNYSPLFTSQFFSAPPIYHPLFAVRNPAGLLTGGTPTLGGGALSPIPPQPSPLVPPVAPIKTITSIPNFTPISPITPITPTTTVIPPLITITISIPSIAVTIPFSALAGLISYFPPIQIITNPTIIDPTIPNITPPIDIIIPTTIPIIPTSSVPIATIF